MTLTKRDARVEKLIQRIEHRDYKIGIVGLGYVGLPLALAAVNVGFRVMGFDINESRVAQLNEGNSGIEHIEDQAIETAIRDNMFRATSKFSELREPDAILIAVPTPLNKQREPDLSYVENSARAISQHLRMGQLVVLESTTWPGTTAERVKPILEESGMVCGQDFFLAYSPEREDPGNTAYDTRSIPKVVGADEASSLSLVRALYESLVSSVVPVASASTAEAVKLTENIFRSVNIALVNELKVIFDRMDIDVWEVIEAAKSKPFGYMPFYPGPGLGGHCIPIDPFYLAWKARSVGQSTRFIELAGEINRAMPDYVIDRLREAVDRQSSKGLNGADILLIGMAYKKNVADQRESPALTILEKLRSAGAKASFHDPWIPEILPSREFGALAGCKSEALTLERLAAADAVLIVTDHDDVDYGLIAEHARLVVDTRNAMRARGLEGTHIVAA